ncbi:hypothetical protein [Roseomonas gilardii]|uniref:hypothetical protein n=1 Tax=Roseomonas gilardii TaxID=257708 RepID=UPI0038CD4D6D
MTGAVSDRAASGLALGYLLVMARSHVKKFIADVLQQSSDLTGLASYGWRVR